VQRGNRSFQAQQYTAAAEAYTQALALGADDAGLNAVLLCNRAAAMHSAGHHLEAVADCCLAEQLDPRSTRALQVGVLAGRPACSAGELG
jgi:predicted TPR repeat methyltransferase